MKIAVNTRLLLPNKLEGIGWFAYETLKRITVQHPEVDFLFLFDRKYDPQLIFSNNVTPIEIGPPSRHPFLWYWWFEHSVAGILQKHNPDIFLSPDGYLSLKWAGKQLPVIHDLNFEHYPEDLPFWYRKYYRNYFPKYAKKASRIATVSEFSKSDIATQYGTDPDKIDVVYNGVSERFKVLSDQEKKETQEILTRGLPYFVFVGAIHPRKNIARMLQAFENFKNSGNYPHQLVLVGKRKWWTREMDSALAKMKYQNSVLFKDNLVSKEVALAVGAAEALLYPSTFEGFGVPILEAMKSGVPVITSEVSSMPEVAGDSALLIDPFSVSNFSEQLKRLVHEPGLSESLVEKGLQRAQDFSWDKTAELLWASAERVC